MKKLLSLNIRHGGGARAGKLLDWTLGTDSDFIIFSEWRCSQIGNALSLELQKRKYEVRTFSSDSQLNSLLFASRNKFELINATPSTSQKGALALADFGALRICAAYFPQKKDKAPFFLKCFELADNNNGIPFLLAGDLNTGNNTMDLEPGAAKFFCDDLFEKLQTKAGLVDLWRQPRGTAAREWTWRSPKNGFRIDHAFANLAFTNTFRDINCYYSHIPRELKLTDHSALFVEFNEG